MLAAKHSTAALFQIGSGRDMPEYGALEQKPD